MNYFHLVLQSVMSDFNRHDALEYSDITLHLQVLSGHFLPLIPLGVLLLKTGELSPDRVNRLPVLELQ